MKTSPWLLRGVFAASLLAALSVANAQNSLSFSSSSSSEAAPPPPPPPPPPPSASAPLINSAATRGATTGRGAFAARGTTGRGSALIARGLPARGPFGSLPPDSLWTSELAMNTAFTVQFNNTGDFGGGRMPSPTMGIDPRMRLSLTDSVKIDGPAKTTTAFYKIYSLELIGIAKHIEPVAFVVVRHKASSATLNTRVLSDFEVSALKELQNGKQVVDKLEKTDRLVVGAVRAEQSCIPCHDGAKVGDLLGAFSYHLSLADAPTTATTIKTASVLPNAPAKVPGGGFVSASK